MGLVFLLAMLFRAAEPSDELGCVAVSLFGLVGIDFSVEEILEHVVARIIVRGEAEDFLEEGRLLRFLDSPLA